MTGMAGNQYFLGTLAWYQIFSEIEMYSLQTGIYFYLVFAVLHPQKILVGQTETPVLAVIRCAIRNQVWLPGQSVKVLFQFLQPHPATDRHTIVHHVQIVFSEINHPLAA